MFNSAKRNETAIQKPGPVDREAEKIFPKYIRITREKLEQSISDARGRYELSQGYRQPKPSQNWKVVGNVAEDPRNSEQALREEVLIWLKVGIKKVVIGEDKNGNPVTEQKQPASMLIEYLEEFLETLNAFGADPSSEGAQAFWKEAIRQARPKSAPVDANNEGLNWFDYDPETDLYKAVALDEETLAKRKAEREAEKAAK